MFTVTIQIIVFFPSIQNFALQITSPPLIVTTATSLIELLQVRLTRDTTDLETGNTTISLKTFTPEKGIRRLNSHQPLLFFFFLNEPPPSARTFIIPSKKVGKSKKSRRMNVEINRFPGTKPVTHLRRPSRLIYRGITLTLHGFMDCANSFGKCPGRERFLSLHLHTHTC